MTTTRVNQNPQVTTQLLKHTCLKDDELYLVDVGASGGIDKFWNVYGQQLRAVAFEPLVNEVDRLNREERNPKIKYESAFVGWKGWKEACKSVQVDQAQGNCTYMRTSALAAQQRRQRSFVQEHFNAGQEVVWTDCHIDLDDYLVPDEYKRVDFLKVDTDGNDFPVLLGAEKLLKEGVIGISIEAQLHGETHDYANVFANIDRYLRGLGFSLYDLDIWRYSRSALPLPFVYNIDGQTHDGPVQWGEAVYFRDFARTDYEQVWNFPVSEARVLKLASLFELYGLNDCAVELLVNRRDQCSSLNDLDSYLDALTPALDGESVTYAQYTERFKQNPNNFYPKKKPILEKVAEAKTGGWNFMNELFSFKKAG